MIVMITKQLRIRSMSDGRCFQLQYMKRSEETGATSWEGWGYHSTLQQTASAALNKAPHLLNDAQKLSVRDLIAAIDKAEKAIVNACEAACTADEAAHFDITIGKNIPAELFDDTGTDG